MNAPTTEVLYLAAASACALAGGLRDLRDRRIPNAITLPALGMGLLLHLVFGGVGQFGLALAAALVGGGAFFIFYLAGGMGAGDVKLMAAVCALSGLNHTTELLIATVLMGGLFALVFAAARGKVLQTMRNVMELARHHRSHGLTPHDDLNVSNAATLRLPYGVAIAAGTLITLCTAVTLR